MKSYFILLMAMVLTFSVSVGVRAQGTINFVNTSTSLVLTYNNGNPIPAPSATYGTRVQLYYQPYNGGVQPQPIGISSGLGSWQPIGNLGTNIASNGRFSVGTCTTGSDVPRGSNVWLMVVAWDGGRTSFTDAINNFSQIGFSTVWSQPTGDPTAFPATSPVSTAGRFSNFIIAGDSYQFIPYIFTSPSNTIYGIGGTIHLTGFAYADIAKTYQWFKNQALVTDGGRISGSTNIDLYITNAQSSDAGNYYFVVSTIAGTATSSVASVTYARTPATVNLTGLSQTYDGTAKSVGVSTTPSNLAYSLTYSGSTSAPTNAGGYTVIATVTDTNYTGFASNVLQIAQAPASISFTNLAQYADGSPKCVTTSTTPPGLTVLLTYNGSTNCPTAIGSYTLNATVVDANYQGTATNLEAISSGVPFITSPPSFTIVPAHSNAFFSASASGPPPLAFQWQFNGTNLLGANASSLTVSNVTPAVLGNYALVAANGYGSVTSTPAGLFMYPYLFTPFAGAVGIWGNELDLKVRAWGSGTLGYQWYKDGNAVSGATSSNLVFNSVQLSDAGYYSVVVTSEFGSVSNTPCEVFVVTADVSMGLSPRLDIKGTAGYSYTIQRSSDLSDTNAWTTLTNITLTNSEEIWVDSSVDTTKASNAKHFYRVLAGQ